MKRWLLTSGLIVAVAGLSLLWWINREQQRVGQLADQWVGSNQSSQQLIDHSIWQELLDNYLETDSEDGVNRFAYGDVDEQDLAQLNQYLVQMSQVDLVQYRKAEQMA